MKSEEFIQIFKESFAIFKNPRYFIWGFILWISIFAISKISYQINKIYTNTFFSITWLVIFFLINLALVSFVLTNLIFLSEKKPKFQNMKKTIFRNILLLLVISLIIIIIGRAAHFGGLFIGKAFGLEIGSAKLVFIGIYFLGIVGFLIFLSFAVFLSTIFNLSFRESIKKSIKSVKKNYIETLCMNLIIFVFFFIFYNFRIVYLDLIEYIILIPYFTKVLANFVLRLK